MAPPDSLANLDHGLKAAFGADSEAPRRPAVSVLAAIEKITGEQSRVLLRDAPGERTPVVTTRTKQVPEGPRDDGRYQIIGEIAQGGVGVVLKGRDTDLGRDLAIKVLLGPHTGDSSMMQRFVEEAQIGAQLQHPGIVPVYELGLRADQRPYFTMKLVKGKTFSAILQARQDPSEDRQKHLHDFEKTCQTMAYAHARGVIHRDLKPANIMVGNFGEVLVVDWGFAKVLGAGGVADERRAQKIQKTQVSIIETIRSGGVGSVGSQSIAGSLMGTPAYMPPEQALGEVDQLDERADVFALGGVLCEILTGAPPYVGDLGDVVVLAAEGKIDDAFQRLDKSGADDELIRLCKRCLAPTRAVRPENANLVAAEMGTYFAAVEKRARAAEIKAVKAKEQATAAQKQAQQERKARRLTLGLAASILAVVVLAGGGFLWVKQGEAERVQKAEQEAGAALREAEQLRGDAKAGNAAKWSEALNVAKRAEALSADAGPETKQQVSDLLQVLEAEQRAASDAAAARQRNETMRARLEDIRAQRGEDAAVVDKAYAAAFLEYGLDIDASDAAAKIRGSTLAMEIAAALDDWRWVNPQRARLFDLAREVDPDKWRNRVREAAKEQDGTRLRTLASSADADSLDVVTLHLLTSSLAHVGERDRALTLLREARQKYPQDFWITYNLAYWSTQGEEPDWNAAIRFYTAALTLRPDSGATLNNRATAFLGQEDADAAIRDLKKALASNPEYIRARTNLAKAFNMKGETDNALDAYRTVLRQQPDSALVANNLGTALEKKGDLKAAIDQYRAALRVDPGFAQALKNLLTALEKDRRLQEAVADCEQVLKQHQQADWAYHSLGYIQARTGRLPEAVKSLRQAVTLNPKNSLAWGDLGSALMRVDDLNGALDAYKKSVEHAPDDIRAYNNLSSAYRFLGDTASEVATLRKALEIEPGSARLHNDMGQALFRIGDDSGAAHHRVEAIRLSPKSGRYHYALGNVLGVISGPEAALAYYRELVPEPEPEAEAGFWHGLGVGIGGRDRDAQLEAYQEGFRLNPRAHWILNSLGRAHARRGEIDEAKAAFRKAVQLGPRNTFPLHNLGHLLRRNNDIGGAARVFDQLIDLNPRALPPYGNRVILHLMRGEEKDAVMALAEAIDLNRSDPVVHGTLGNVCGAAEKLTEKIIEVYKKAFRAVVRDPSPIPQAGFYRGLGDTLTGRGFHQEAIRAHAEAIQLLPDNATLHNHKGVAHWRARDFAGSEKAVRQAVQLQPNEGLFHRNLGLVSTLMGKNAQARDSFSEAIRLDPKSALSLDALADFLALCPDRKFRDPPEAVQLARKAVLLGPRTSAYRSTLGAAYYRAGAYKEALITLKRAIELRGKSRSQDSFMLAMTYWKLGKKTQAREWYDGGVPLMNKNSVFHEFFEQIRVEAAKLLGVEK